MTDEARPGTSSTVFKRAQVFGETQGEGDEQERRIRLARGGKCAGGADVQVPRAPNLQGSVDDALGRGRTDARRSDLVEAVSPLVEDAPGQLLLGEPVAKAAAPGFAQPRVQNLVSANHGVDVDLLEAV